jgi:hypothetical protein
MPRRQFADPSGEFTVREPEGGRGEIGGREGSSDFAGEVECEGWGVGWVVEVDDGLVVVCEDVVEDHVLEFLWEELDSGWEGFGREGLEFGVVHFRGLSREIVDGSWNFVEGDVEEKRSGGCGSFERKDVSCYSRVQALHVINKLSLGC